MTEAQAAPADETGGDKAAELPSGDASFTPTLWGKAGPDLETKPSSMVTPCAGATETKDTRNDESTAPENTPHADADAADAVPLSKNARKRAAKHDLWQAKKMQKKGEEKAAKTLKAEEAKAAFSTKMQEMTEAEKAEYEAGRKANRDERMKQAETAKAKKHEALHSPFSVVLDLEFGALMTEKEVKSMAKQLCYCYSSNGKAAVPAAMYFTGLDGDVGEALTKASPGYQNWAVHHKPEPYIDALSKRKNDLVYLTADSENELTDFVANEIYVIGGIVDRNRHKNLTLNKAKEQGIRHARLPIQKHLALSGTHVLTVNQVVDIILAQLELKNWDLAMEKAVPMRKHAKEEPGKQTKEEGDGELSE